MSRYLLTLCIAFQCILISNQATAQQNKFQLSGTLIDSVSGKPGEFFTIALSKDSTVIKSAVSNEHGKFSFSGIVEGNYKVIIGALGYKSKIILVKLSRDTDLSKILVVSSGNELREVAVAASRPLIKQEPDRIVYDIQADAESKVLSVPSILVVTL